jgi:Flp pilus assembly protein TadD
MSLPPEHRASPPAASAPLELLEADELLALGLQARAATDAAAALAFFKLAVARHPGHARAHWMLGAEYAALQLPDRAHEHLARAVALDPAQPVARFQLGLLRLTRGDVGGAEQAWRGLDDRPAGDPLRRFGRGLLLLAGGRPAEARLELQAAADDPATDPALRRDLEAVLGRIDGGDAGRPTAAPTESDGGHGAPSAPEASIERHLALSAYAGGVRA